ncbi:MAG: hypothetical protein ACM30E_11095, partial [Nitrososphaerales archaeon]
MKNAYFSIGATLKQLLQRMQQYAQTSLPPEFEYLRLAADPLVPIWPEGGLSWLGTFYAVSLLEEDVPFFEMGAQEVNDVCRVRIRCLDPRAANWVRQLINWLAPGRASGARAAEPFVPLPAALRRAVPVDRLGWQPRG